ncbi:MAG: hypothetical protein ABI867_23690, partial [Kofleriaceae bacterium]
MDQTTFDAAFDAGVIATRLAVVREQLQAIASTLEMTRSPDMQELPATFPVSWLSEQLRLTPTEVTALWVLLAHELCPRSREAMRQLTTEDVADVTLDSLRRAAYGAPSVTAWRDLGATGTLMRSGLIERDAVAAPEHRQAVRVNARVVALLHGVLELDDEVSAFARFDDSTVTLAELEVDGDAVRAIEQACERDGLVIVRGGAGTGRRSLVSAIARARGHRLLVVDGGALATDRERAARQLRIIARECVLFGAVPMIRQLDALA